MQCHYRLQFDDEGYPMLYVFSCCPAFLRTIPRLCHSELVPEDLDTRQEDHIADEWRYMAMSRPIRPTPPQPAAPVEEDPLSPPRKRRP